jgi:hypothetical protein
MCRPSWKGWGIEGGSDEHEGRWRPAERAERPNGRRAQTIIATLRAGRLRESQARGARAGV